MDLQSLSIFFFWEKLKLQAVVKKWRHKYVGNHPLYSQVEGQMQREISEQMWQLIWVQGCRLKPLNPKVWLLILSSSCYTFLLNKLQEFGVRSREQPLPDKFEYSQYLFCGWCMDIIGRIYMLITSGSWSFCQISPKTGNYSDIMPPLDKWIYVIFFIEADKLWYWSTIYTVLLWIFEATPSWPRCKQWSTREKVSQQCLWKMQRNVQMFWFNTVHNEASAYHENPNSKVSINMKIQHFPSPLPTWAFEYLKIGLFNTLPQRAKLCWNTPPKCWIWWSLF